LSNGHTGERFGRLTIVRATDRRYQRAILYDCLCDCGNTVYVRIALLRNGNTKSCGCLQRERASDGGKTHGLWGTPLYYVLRAMIRRCHDPRDAHYDDYGGRGITVCERWRESVAAFVEDVTALGTRGNLRRSLDRIDNDGNYEPGNVRWATQREQMRNTRRNVHVEIGGEARLLVDAQRESGVQPMTYYGRLARGASVIDAITTPVRPQSRSGGIRGTWRSILRRCHGRVGDPLRKNYGDRGIAMHEPWRDYATFERDMLALGEDLPNRIARECMDLDRFDPELDYEPGNVRWLPRSENARRHRTGKLPPPTRPPSPSLVMKAVQEETCRHCGGPIPEERRERGRRRNAPVNYCARECKSDASNERQRERKIAAG
jgi:hypothetical protein